MTGMHLESLYMLQVIIVGHKVCYQHCDIIFARTSEQQQIDRIQSRLMSLFLGPCSPDTGIH